MKFINNKIILFFAVLCTGILNAQEIIPEEVQDSIKKPFEKGRTKVDGVVAVVGDFVVLDSDINLAYIELKAQGISVKDFTRCELLGKLMEDKLYAHWAIQDSIIVSDAEVNDMTNSRINYFVEQIGSVEKMVSYFKKKDEETFRAELSEMIKNQKLTEEMQKKITDEVQITPEEVRKYYIKIPKEELPVFGAEMEVAQIVIKPVITQAEKQKVIDKLSELRKEVQEGASFFSKAVLYSEDPGTRSSGGFLKINRKMNLAKEFKETAYKTEEGQISEPFETEFGFHIIYVEKIRGQEMDIRHILISPKVTNESLKQAKEKIDNIRKRIVAGEITFAEAARSESDEKETRNSGGLLMNPRTLETRFELTKLPPSIYNDVSELKDGEVTQPILDDDPRSGKSYKLMTVTNRYDEHTADYVQDYVKIKELALREKQIQAIAKWSGEKIKETYVKVNGEYRDCKFANNWVK